MRLSSGRIITEAQSDRSRNPPAHLARARRGRTVVLCVREHLQIVSRPSLTYTWIVMHVASRFSLVARFRWIDLK